MPNNQRPPRHGIAYSALADLALGVGMMATIVGSIIALVALTTALFSNNFRQILSNLLGFFILLALFVVFRRVADMK